MTNMVGGCQCGQIRYRIEGPRPIVYACHCRECQKQSASAFGMSMPVAFAQVRVGGMLASFERATDLGTRTRCFFCSDCGSRLYHRSSSSPDHVTIKAGSLDDTSGLRPVAHIWVSRRQPWVVLDADVPTHDTQPDDLEGWRAGMTGKTT